MQRVITQVIKQTIDHYSIKDQINYMTRTATECSTRQMTDEEKAKYENVQGQGKRSTGMNLWPRARKGAYMQKWNKNRDNIPCEVMNKLRKEGKSFLDIGQKFGISADRVYEMLRRRALRKDKLNKCS